MAVRSKYTPPRRNAALLLRAAADVAEDAMAHELLDASQPLVPVEMGVMKASGKVVAGPIGHAVTYGSDQDGTTNHAPSNQYVVKQHEDQDLNHPNGGTAKFLEKAMHSAHAAMLAAGGAALKRIFR